MLESQWTSNLYYKLETKYEKENFIYLLKMKEYQAQNRSTNVFLKIFTWTREEETIIWNEKNLSFSPIYACKRSSIIRVEKLSENISKKPS
jgi:hypothetical protein